MRSALLVAGFLAIVIGLAGLHWVAISPGVYSDAEWHVDLLLLGAIAMIVLAELWVPERSRRR